MKNNKDYWEVDIRCPYCGDRIYMKVYHDFEKYQPDYTTEDIIASEIDFYKELAEKRCKHLAYYNSSDGEEYILPLWENVIQKLCEGLLEEYPPVETSIKKEDAAKYIGSIVNRGIETVRETLNKTFPEYNNEIIQKPFLREQGPEGEGDTDVTCIYINKE